MKKMHFREWGIESPRYWGLLAILAGIMSIAGIAWYYMEHNGHWVTGMNNHVVWGTPHVFAVFLIVAASGALNVASIASVFGKKDYKPLAPLSGLLAITLLVAGLLVLVLDLGRPDRLIVAMTHYNFKSIFAWNIYLYTGFLAIVVIYLWTMMERKMNRFTKAAGTFAFVWRLALTTGTGSIFGFIVARQGYDAAIYAPMFIVMSFAFGLAIYLLVLMFAFDWDKRELGEKLFLRLKNLLGVFVAGALYFVIAYHLTNLYGTENHEYEAFILLNGGVYTLMFWVGQILIGSLLPLAIVYHPALGQSRNAVAAACFMVVLGGLATMYVIIIGGQAFPMAMFPGKEIIDSTFYDGGISPYAPSLPEIALGLGGVAAALLMTAIGIRMLRFLPETLSDKALDPHS
jgi:Ni/Fe-hydrogenase subunit HybB-like protein